MSRPAVKDPDHPSGGASSCSESEMRGYFVKLYPCVNDGNLYYRIKQGDDIELDFNPERVIVKHGNTKAEIRSNEVNVESLNVNVVGNLNVDGDISSTGIMKSESDVLALGGLVSLINHVHKFQYQTTSGLEESTTKIPEKG